LFLSPSIALAQVVAPSQVVPHNIAPSRPPVAAASPQIQGQSAPDVPVDPALAVDTGSVEVEGAFPDLASANAVFSDHVAHRHLTLAELYAAARNLEQAYARQGYILVRVTVPPQRLDPGAQVRVVVTDGFIEEIDTSGVAAPLQSRVKATLAALIGRRRITGAEIERALLIAGDTAGARLRSAIGPGVSTGGVRLVVEGRYVRTEGQLSVDNSLPASLGQWQVSGNLVRNGVAEAGDQLYLSTGTQTDITRYGLPRSPLQMIGGGYIRPLGTDGATLTGEYLTSRTQPITKPGSPESVGAFTRGVIRLTIPAIRTRTETLRFNGSIESISQSETLPQFGERISLDRYTALRIGADWQRDLGGLPVALSVMLSQGLTGRDGTHALPVSRQGTASDFSTLDATAHTVLPGPNGLGLDLTARSRADFGRPLFLSEQFALDATNGVSSFPGGSFNVDAGATVRGELHLAPQALGSAVAIVPYAFGAGGWGVLERPTAVERAHISAGSAGVGARFGFGSLPGLNGVDATLNVELGRQFSNLPRLRDGERASVWTALRF